MRQDPLLFWWSRRYRSLVLSHPPLKNALAVHDRATRQATSIHCRPLAYSLAALVPSRSAPETRAPFPPIGKEQEGRMRPKDAKS